MAPLLRILVQVLPNLPSTPHSPSPTTDLQLNLNEAKLQRPIVSTGAGHEESHLMQHDAKTISVVSRIKNRLDVFGLAENNLTHKFWDGYQWKPAGLDFEILGNGLATPPSAVTWGGDRLDIFGLDDHAVIKHQFWDGTAWLPKDSEFENLGAGCSGEFPITVTTWGQDRLDVFCHGPNEDLRHQYYDGSQWQPSVGSTETLGGVILSAPKAVSWGKNRLDIFAVGHFGLLIHLYWDGSQWSQWEDLGGVPDLDPNSLTVSTWGENRLDIWGTDEISGLWHKYWDGSQWSEWENLGVTNSADSVSVASWGPNRLDIVARNDIGQYLYKFYDGSAWQPDAAGWYNKGPFGGEETRFASSPSVVSWGENRLDVFGESHEGALLHQAWTGYDWYPASTEWENLGGGVESEKSSHGRASSGGGDKGEKSSHGRVFFGGGDKGAKSSPTQAFFGVEYKGEKSSHTQASFGGELRR